MSSPNSAHAKSSTIPVAGANLNYLVITGLYSFIQFTALQFIYYCVLEAPESILLLCICMSIN
jgi:hypothetical protein